MLIYFLYLLLTYYRNCGYLTIINTNSLDISVYFSIYTYNLNYKNMALDKKEYMKQYREKNKERLAEQNKEYREKNKKRIAENKKEYGDTPMGRAVMLVTHYNQLDKKYGRGKGNLIAQWVHDNILFEKCVYCGATGWRLIGCNRIDNTKPHTTDNVEPCCKKCNNIQYGKELAKQVYQYTLDGELVAIYPSTMEAARQTGFNQSLICACCLGKRKTHKGFIWSYVPLDIKKED